MTLFQKNEALNELSTIFQWINEKFFKNKKKTLDYCRFKTRHNLYGQKAVEQTNSV